MKVNLEQPGLELTVAHLMTEDPFAVQAYDPLSKVKALMDQEKIRHVPVVDDEGSLLGLVTHRDLVKSALYAADHLNYQEEMNLLAEIKVDEIYTRDPESVEEDTPLAEAARILLENKFGCLPVVKRGSLIGILTEADFVRFVADLCQGSAATREDDAAQLQ